MWLAVIGVIGIVGVGDASPSRRDCSDAGLRRARAAANRLARQKEYGRAAGILEPLLRCPTPSAWGTLTEEAGWLRSDLAFAYAHMQDYEACLQVMSGVGVFVEDERNSERLGKAMEHNGERCERGLQRRYALAASGCAIAVDDAIAIAPAPRELLPPGTRAACVALLPAVADPGCPTVALVWRGAGRVVERRPLPADGDGVLSDPDRCRGLSAIAAGALDGKAVVRVQGDCASCKHTSGIDVFYTWSGTALGPTLDLSN